MSTEPPGIRLLRGLSRRQILFKLLVGQETESFCAFLTEKAEEARDGAQASFEYNPVSMI